MGDGKRWKGKGSSMGDVKVGRKGSCMGDGERWEENGSGMGDVKRWGEREGQVGWVTGEGGEGGKGSDMGDGERWRGKVRH